MATGNAINANTAGIVGYNGTGTFTGTAATQHAVLVGGASSSTITNLTVGSTGQLLVAATTADPAFAASATGDFTFTSSTAGATRTLTVSNTDNTNTASTALVQTTVGGGSAGDPVHTFTVTGGSSWSQGIDNSASDAYVIAASTALGTTNTLSIDTGGTVTVPLNNLVVSRSSVGGAVFAQIFNTDNTNGASNSCAYILSGGASGGDPQVNYEVNGVQGWATGMDNSDSDKYKLCIGSSLGTNDVMIATIAGQVTMPLQPAFFAYVSATVSNVTGDGTAYTVIFDTEAYDIGGNYNNATGIFTAPVTGKYHFDCGVAFTDIGASNTIASLTLATPSYSPANSGFNPFVNKRSDGFAGINFSADVLLTSGQTAHMVLNVGTAGKTIDVYGDASSTSFFSGRLIC